MRLINVHSLRLEEVWNESEKKYAILSHRWGDGEVSFSDFQNLELASSMQGFSKIRQACEHAKGDGLEYVWVDTCCINKESSAELSEAINSMYRWYKASAVCYALLSDVYTNGVSDEYELNWRINSSAWFTRGWTLQELIAPQKVVFHDRNWDVLGTKQSFKTLLTAWTGIHEGALTGEPLAKFSIAQRMSWAAKRITTREEDCAYCLLGIFDVNMPLLYGERRKAFVRLQEEIIKTSDDQTIFAWAMTTCDQSGHLAESPAAFEYCRGVKPSTTCRGGSPFFMSNRGLSVRLLARPLTVDTYWVRLDCVDKRKSRDFPKLEEYRLVLFLRRLGEDDQYARIQYQGESIVQEGKNSWTYPGSYEKRHESTRPPSLEKRLPIFECLPAKAPVLPKEVQIFVKQQQSDVNSKYFSDRVDGFRIATPDIFKQASTGDPLLFTVDAFEWDSSDYIMTRRSQGFSTGAVGMIDIRRQDYAIKAIRPSFDFDWNPYCCVDFGITDLDDLRPYRSNRTVFPPKTTEHRRWNHVYKGGYERLKTFAREAEHNKGILSLKGDLIDGLHVSLDLHYCRRSQRGGTQHDEEKSLFLVCMRGRAGYIHEYAKDLGMNDDEAVYPLFYLRQLLRT